MSEAPAPLGPGPLGIVLVNYNRWQDTIECLESVLRSDHPVRIVVVDNASADGSLEKIAAWAQGTLPAEPGSPAMASFTTPPWPKPLAFERLDAHQHPGATATALLTLVASGGNLGFAGGNNIGMRMLFADPAITQVWLLNNDTIIAPDTARHLSACLAQPGIGIAGTVVRFYFRPDTVQAWCGNRFSRLTGQSSGIGHGAPATPVPPKAEVLGQLDYVLGASIAITRDFFANVGPMEDSYFLYFEEIDWAVRNQRLGARAYGVGWADDAIVWHKEGGSIGSSATPGARPAFSEYWLSRARLAFIARHFPALLPLHWLVTLALAARRLARQQPDKAKALMRALFGQAFSP